MHSPTFHNRSSWLSLAALLTATLLGAAVRDLARPVAGTDVDWLRDPPARPAEQDNADPARIVFPGESASSTRRPWRQ